MKCLVYLLTLSLVFGSACSMRINQPSDVLDNSMVKFTVSSALAIFKVTEPVLYERVYKSVTLFDNPVLGIEPYFKALIDNTPMSNTEKYIIEQVFDKIVPILVDYAKEQKWGNKEIGEYLAQVISWFPEP